MAPTPDPLPELAVVGAAEPAEVDLDTGRAGRGEVAALVATARLRGASTVRTAEPRAARRSAHVVDVLVAARRAEEGG